MDTKELSRYVKELHNKNRNTFDISEDLKECYTSRALIHLMHQHGSLHMLDKAMRRISREFTTIHLCPYKYINEFKGKSSYNLYRYICMHYMIYTHITCDDRCINFKTNEPLQPLTHYCEALGKVLK